MIQNDVCNKSLAEDFQIISQIPKKYVVHLPVESAEEFLFSANRKNTVITIKLFVNKVYSYHKAKKVLAIFNSDLHFENKNFSVEINYFHGLYRYNIKEKQYYTFKGPLVYKDEKYSMCHPIVINNSPEKLSIEPIYCPNNKNNNDFKKKVMKAFLNPFIIDHSNSEWLSDSIIQAFNWKSFLQSLYYLHFPQMQGENKLLQLMNTEKRLKASLNRVALDELVYYYNEHNALRASYYSHSKGKFFYDFISSWRLTESQEQAMSEISADLKNSKRMFRLLYGEVGSGKTIIAFASSLIAIDSGCQAAIIAPTQILAEQMYHKFLEQTKGAVRCILLVSQTKKEKFIKLEDAQMIIGTHAVCNLDYEKLGIIIFDEQHRFGVKQRLKLINQESAADILFMSATPIPRTLFMTRHNFMDVSYLEGNRSNVKSYLFPLELVHKVIDRVPVWLKDSKVFWVCCTVRQFKDIAGCLERFESIKKIMGPEYPGVFLIHGDQPEEERNYNLQGFANSKNAILVATSIIEVGINIPDSNIIIIENAERFGLSQLHQLRGRVGRNGQEGKCMFLYKNTEESKGRLDFIASTNNCRFLSDFDMKNRGAGDLKGVKQQGKTRWKFLSKAPEALELSKKLHKYQISEKQSDFIRQLFDSIKIEATVLS